MSIYRGFEGFRDPDELDVLELLKRVPIVLDTNVLLEIYSFEEPSRLLALGVLEGLKDQIWIPHQVMREFWRNRHATVAAIPAPTQPIASVRNELLGIVNGLRPDSERPEDIQEIRGVIESQLSVLSAAIDKARGTPLDIGKILKDTSADPILVRFDEIFLGRIGSSFGAEEAEMIDEGLRRFETLTPPGYEDAKEKFEQLPERGTGDFLLWEQTLQYITSLDDCNAFVLVTNDSKEDWRVVIHQPRKTVLGVRPELVAEALARTGSRVIVLSQSDFYRLMAKLHPVDEVVSESLIAASRRTSDESVDGDSGGTWSYASYQRLLNDLMNGGNSIQAEVISLAASRGGFVLRAKIYEIAGFSEERSLRRFSLPAQRVALALVDEGLLRDDAAPPLEAIYEGSVKTVGYRVPNEFVEYEQVRLNSTRLTWIQAAVRVAKSEPERVWSVADLVEEISNRGLRDLSDARTPEATLRRDLSQRDDVFFEDTEGGYRLKAAHE